MAKKYLLYIHDELFEKEPRKSQLVNNLLERHYHDTVGGKTQEGVKKIIKTKQEAVRAVEGLSCKGQHYMSRKNCGRSNCPWR